MSQRFANKVALVTGGTSGIGLATAQLFAEEGAVVYVTGRREAELAKAVEAIGANGRGVRGDVSKLADLDGLFARIKAEQGHLDIVFANAGGGSFASLGEITEEHYDQTFDINVKGVVFTVQGALPLLRPGASIILNSSIVGQRAQPAFSIYGATKAAVRSLARGWAPDLRGRNIRVNAVSPGFIPTPAYEKLGLSEEMVPTDNIPLGRPGLAREIATAVAFLASSESSYITGEEITVDGGFTQV